MLSQLQEAYDYPVDVEFAANFQDEQNYKINVVQCRPLQIKEGGSIVEPPPDLSKEDRLVEAHGIVIGQSRLSQVDQIIYIVPRHYGELPVARRYAVARLIGKATQSRGRRRPGNIMLLGPGRWGTTTPSLGIPVRFAEISNVSIICEIVTMRDNLVPDVSLGTHFFSEMVELDMLYFALFPHKRDNVINEKRILDLPNRLLDVVPEADDWTDMVRMVDAADLGGRLLVNANPLKQRVVAYVEEARPDEE
jgi:hypothetical protein